MFVTGLILQTFRASSVNEEYEYKIGLCKKPIVE